MISESLEISPDLLLEKIQDANIILRLNYYPKGTPEGGIWAGEHTDIDLFTILPSSKGAGLQVQEKNGKWIDVIVPSGSYIVNCGDMLQNLTNGHYRSAVHRVVEKGENKDRYSIVYFVHPRPECSVSPLPLAIEKTGGIQRYPNAIEQELFSVRMMNLGIASEEMVQYAKDSGILDRLDELGLTF
ncbi:MAG: 2OG-Fe(II) oxygenase family protein [Candidatus Algichlamydia australiensis]|nr:2OG-Fe(II) oxygenase family protein [Chlamydiales bacterium]